MSILINDFKNFVTGNGPYTSVIHEGIENVLESEKKYFRNKIGNSALVNREQRYFDDYWLYITERFCEEKLFNDSSQEFLLKEEDDKSKFKGGIRFLFKQFLNNIYLKDNPHINEINNNVKKLLKSKLFSDYFLFSNNEFITKSKIGFNNQIDEKSFLNSIREILNSEKDINLAISIFDSISEEENNSISYSSLINKLKEKMGITEISFNENDDNNDSPQITHNSIAYIFSQLKNFLEKAVFIVSINYQENDVEYEDYSKLVELFFKKIISLSKNTIQIFNIIFDKIDKLDEITWEEDFNVENNKKISMNFDDNINSIKKNARKVKTYVKEVMAEKEIGKTTVYNTLLLIDDTFVEFSLKHELNIGNEINFIGELNTYVNKDRK